MGYSYYITRKENWSDLSGPPITNNDWLGYLSIDPGFQLDRNYSESADPDVASGAKDPTHARWLDGPGETPVWIWLEQGNLVTEDADAAFRSKLFLVADSLSAKFCGQNGEMFDSSGQKLRKSHKKAKRSLWRLWRASRA